MPANIYHEVSVCIMTGSVINRILYDKKKCMCRSNLLGVELLVGRPGVDGGAVVAEGVVQRLDAVQQRVGHRVAAERPLQREKDPRLANLNAGLAAHFNYAVAITRSAIPFLKSCGSQTQTLASEAARDIEGER